MIPIHDCIYVWKLLSELNTIEGLLGRAITGLGQDQPVRKVHLATVLQFYYNLQFILF